MRTRSMPLFEVTVVGLPVSDVFPLFLFSKSRRHRHEKDKETGRIQLKNKWGWCHTPVILVLGRQKRGFLGLLGE